MSPDSIIAFAAAIYVAYRFGQSEADEALIIFTIVLVLCTLITFISRWIS